MRSLGISSTMGIKTNATSMVSKNGMYLISIRILDISSEEACKFIKSLAEYFCRITFALQH